MITIGDARYVLSEIKAIPYYDERIARIQAEIDTIQQQIENCSSPVSPNGGDDFVIGGRAVRIKITGNHSFNRETLITELITAQAPLEAELREFVKRRKTAQQYKESLLNGRESGFSTDFLEGTKSYSQLQKEYHCSNAYDRMLRVIRATIHRR